MSVVGLPIYPVTPSRKNLYAVYETTDRNYWTELARFNQQEFLKSGTEGKCIEARELIIALRIYQREVFGVEMSII